MTQGIRHPDMSVRSFPCLAGITSGLLTPSNGGRLSREIQSFCHHDRLSMYVYRRICTMSKYYAVVNGREPGIYRSWDACKQQVGRETLVTKMLNLLVGGFTLPSV